MRLFVACMASEKLNTLVHEWSADKQSWPVRWVGSQRLHLTLIPPFEAIDVNPIISALAEVTVVPIIIRYRIVSFGPNRRQPRLIWAVGQTGPELEELKRRIEVALGLIPEPREFRPHLTIARFRPESFRNLPIADLYEKIDWTEEIRNFKLIESILKPGGAEYRVVQRY